MPVGNWSLIGSEVERDQLAPSELRGKRRGHETKTDERQESGEVGWQGSSVKKTQNQEEKKQRATTDKVH